MSRLQLALNVDDIPATRGRLAGYRLRPFVRMGQDGNERLADAAAAGEPRIARRIEAILRPGEGGGR